MTEELQKEFEVAWAQAVAQPDAFPRQFNDAAKEMAWVGWRLRAQYIAEEPSIHKLTDKERQVVTFTSKGLSYKETAQHLGISVNVVNERLKSVFVKLERRTKVEVAVWAAKNGLV